VFFLYLNYQKIDSPLSLSVGSQKLSLKQPIFLLFEMFLVSSTLHG
jgi:hypothetical protein